jgi:Sec-independent protein secretion pathway component TatC
MAVPLVVLYVGSSLIAVLVTRKRRNKKELEATEDE